MATGQETSQTLRPTWFEIDLGAIRHNFRELRRLVGPAVAIYACMKRNAYGCGIIPVSKACLEEGAAGIAVGSANDAVAIRNNGIRGSILVYPACLADAAPLFERYEIIPTISTVDDAKAWNAALTKPREIFLKVDVGLFRAGTMFNQADRFFSAVKTMSKLKPIGVYSHFFSYGADQSPQNYHWQFQNFQEAVAQATKANFGSLIYMVSSTNAVLDFPQMDLAAIDPGRLLFGLGVSATGARSGAFRPALSAFKSRIVTMKATGALHLNEYQPPFPVRDNMVIGVLPLGWGDGLPRKVGSAAEVLVRGRRAPLLDPIHLEHSRIDLTEITDAEIGDEVVIVGRQGSAEIKLREVVEKWGIDEATFHGSMRDHISRVYV